MNKSIRNALRIAKPVEHGKKTFKRGGRTGYATSGSVPNDDITKAMHLARTHFGFGGDSDAAEGSHYSDNISHDSVSNEGPGQHETMNAFEARQDPQRYSDYEGNRLTAEERGPAPPQGGDIVQPGLGQSIFRNDSGELSVGQNNRSDVAGPTANQIATEQANQEENRAMAANVAMAQRAGPMTGQPEAPTFTGNTTEEQQLKDAEASRQAGINAAITGANYTAPGTVNVADVVKPDTDMSILGIMGRLAIPDIQPSYPRAGPSSSFASTIPQTAQPAPNPYAQGQMPQPLGYDLKTPGQPTINPYAQGQMPQPVGSELKSPVQDAIVSDALMKAATFQPSQDAALRTARNEIIQSLGLPDEAKAATTTQPTSGLGAATPAVASAPPTAQAYKNANVSTDTYGPNMTEAQIAAQQKVINNGPLTSDDVAALSNQQRQAYYNAGQMTVGVPTGNFLADLFSGKLGSTVSEMDNKRGGNDRQQVQAPYIPPVGVATTPAPVPVVPGTPAPYTYAARTPYVNYGANGAGIGNIAPISYGDPINWSLVPGYRAAGGRVGENNALANVLRMLAQNRS